MTVLFQESVLLYRHKINIGRHPLCDAAIA